MAGAGRPSTSLPVVISKDVDGGAKPRHDKWCGGRSVISSVGIRRPQAMWTVGFLVMFFGLLAAGMPIFLVLGASAAILYFVSGQPMIGVAQNMIDQLNSTTL